MVRQNFRQERLGEKMKATKTSEMPKVYSYIRFSNPKQALGNSERRQLEMTEAFAKRKGLPFDETLRMTDKGLSGYHGDHRKKGVLGQFLHKVENGAVPSGSFLVVENIDRLSREGVVATLREIIFKLWDYSITLQTLSPEEHYEKGCDNEPKFIGLWLYMNRAYDESRRKSERIKEARKNARRLAHEEGKILTARCPAWLDVVKDDDGKPTGFKIIPEAEETIKKIFDLKLKGVGKTAIAKILNGNGVWKPPANKRSKGNGWRESYIQKILQNRAVIGEYQPYQINSKTGKRETVGEPIQKYFPRVISDNIFYALQEQIKENKGKGGQNGKASNLFRHLVKCPYCGGSMTFVNKGKSYLVCDNGRRGNGCIRYSIRYDECEKVILENCKGLKPNQVLPNPDEQAKFCQSLRKRIQGYIAKQQDIEKRISRLVTNISEKDSKRIAALLKNEIAKLQEQDAVVKFQQEKDERKLRKAESSLQSFTKWQKDLASLQKAIKGNDVELRIHLQTHLRELIEKIEVFAVGFKELYDFDKDDGIHSGLIIAKKEIIETVKASGIAFRVLKKSNGDIKKIIIKSPGYFDNTETIENELYDVAGEADPKLVRSELFRDFVKNLTKRRMSKEGRFLRIHFKTGAWVDVVPKGSIAFGAELIKVGKKDNWRFVKPNISILWNENNTAKQTMAVG